MVYGDDVAMVGNSVRLGAHHRSWKKGEEGGLPRSSAVAAA
jgi:hypothetical protein